MYMYICIYIYMGGHGTCMSNINLHHFILKNCISNSQDAFKGCSEDFQIRSLGYTNCGFFWKKTLSAEIGGSVKNFAKKNSKTVSSWK